MTKITTIILLSLLARFTVSNAQPDKTSIKIYGIVIDEQSGLGLENVNIRILNTTMGTITDHHGNYSISLTPGEYQFEYSMIGYQTVKKEIKLISNEMEEVNIAMTPTIYLMQGVTIIDERTVENDDQVSNLSMQSEKIVNMPGSFTDIYRSVKTLPGVSSNNGQSSEFNVRGGTFEENLVVVNGIQVYQPFHIKAAPNASVAIFNMDLLSNVNLITGGYTARYGDKMSSVLNIKYREGRPEDFAGKIDISSIHASFQAEGPFLKGNWLLAARKSYLRYILNLLDFEKTLDIDFYDIQGNLFYPINPNYKLSIFFIHSGDIYLDDPVDTFIERENFVDNGAQIQYQKEEIVEKDKGDYCNNLFALSLRSVINHKCFMNTNVSYYYEYEDEQYTELSNYVVNYLYNTNGYVYFHDYDEYNKRNLTIKTSEFKHDITYQIHPYHELNYGFSYKHIDYDFKYQYRENYTWGSNWDTYPDTSISEDHMNYSNVVNPSSYKASTYIEDNWQLSKSVFTNIGIRLDYFDFNEDLNISPRINLSYRTKFGGIFRTAWGYYYQAPGYNELLYDYKTSDNTKAQLAVHYIAGFEYPINDHFNFKIETYYKDMDNLISFEYRRGSFLYSRVNDSKGYAQGLDFIFKTNWDKFSGWLSYSYLIAKEDSLGDNHGYVYRSTDQRHTLSIVTSLDLGKNWTLRLKGMYGSGFPYTLSSMVEVEENRYQRVYGIKNSARLPAYKRIDLRIGKNFNIGKYRLDSYFEIINLFNHKNVFAYQWEYNNGRWNKDAITLLPIIPNIGLSFVF